MLCWLPCGDGLMALVQPAHCRPHLLWQSPFLALLYFLYCFTHRLLIHTRSATSCGNQLDFIFIFIRSPVLHAIYPHSQTREALAHARSAGCPVVVALTKCDLPNANPARVKQHLLAEGVELEEYGGAVQMVHTSVVSGLGLPELQEALTLQVCISAWRVGAGDRGKTVLL